jgi:hypothetical protein
MTDSTQISGPDETPVDRVRLQERVHQIGDRLFLLEEVPVQTPFTIDVLFDRLEEVTAEIERFAYVVDVSRVQRPDARTREKLKERVAKINPRIAHVGVVVGANAVIRAVARLTAFASGFRSFSFHASIDEATEACRRALQ